MAKESKQQEDTTLEELFSNIDGIVVKLESGDSSLEESFQLYKEGMDMLKTCNDKIDRVEKQMLVLDENGETHDL